MKKMRQKWKRLTFRLLYTACMTFLPLNLLAIAVCVMVIFRASDQVQASYERELDSFMTQFGDDLIKVEDSVEDFILKYLSELTLSGGGDMMVCYEMLEDLSTGFNSSGQKGFLYLYNRSENRMFIKYPQGSYSVEKIEKIKQRLSGHYSMVGTSPSWEIEALDGSYFLAKKYWYPNYQLGFQVDLEERLYRAMDENLWQADEVYLSDRTTLLCRKDGKVSIVNGTRKTRQKEKKFLSKSTEWSSDELGLYIAVESSQGQFWKMVPSVYWVLLLAAVGAASLVVVLWKAMQVNVMTPLETLHKGIKELEQNHLDYRIQEIRAEETEEFKYVFKAFNEMAAEIGLSHEKDIKMYQAQLANLKLQVNPHMLLNSFNMIYSLAQSKNFECIQEYSLHLVEYFRYVLKENDTFVSLDKEMHFVENYIEIQKIRFPGAFTSVYFIQEACRGALVPPLLIQNFVENAMKYALIPGKTIEVLINIRKEEEKLLVSICDTGRGMKPEILECLQRGELYVDKLGQKHIGVLNCRMRMEVFYGKENTSMNIISSPGEGTQVWLELPFIGQEEEAVR